MSQRSAESRSASSTSLSTTTQAEREGNGRGRAGQGEAGWWGLAGWRAEGLGRELSYWKEGSCRAGREEGASSRCPTHSQACRATKHMRFPTILPISLHCPTCPSTPPIPTRARLSHTRDPVAQLPSPKAIVLQNQGALGLVRMFSTFRLHSSAQHYPAMRCAVLSALSFQCTVLLQSGAPQCSQAGRELDSYSQRLCHSMGAQGVSSTHLELSHHVLAVARVVAATVM